MRRFLVIACCICTLAAVEEKTNTAHAKPMTTPPTTMSTPPVTIIHTPTQWQGMNPDSSLKLNADSLETSSLGILTSAIQTAPPFDELVPSWNSTTNGGGSLTLEVRVKIGEQWTGWYSFGQWGKVRSSATSKDHWGEVDTDTLKLKKPATAWQYRVILQQAKLHLVSINTSRRSHFKAGLGKAGNPLLWGKVITVPQRSQMIYPGGGEAWCSPTSTSMIMAFRGIHVDVPQAAAATYDHLYGGTGNWAFNAAYAGEQGLRAYLTRLPHLAAAEPFIAAGKPLALSLGWKKGELAGAFIPSSEGHLMVLVGFDSAGNPVLNDPAAPEDNRVRVTYPRAAFERLWLSHSGGLAYVVEPRQ